MYQLGFLVWYWIRVVTYFAVGFRKPCCLHCYANCLRSFIHLFKFMCGCLFACMSVYHVYSSWDQKWVPCPLKSVLQVVVSSHMGSRTLTQDLWKAASLLNCCGISPNPVVHFFCWSVSYQSCFSFFFSLSSKDSDICLLEFASEWNHLGIRIFFFQPLRVDQRSWRERVNSW